MDTLSADLMTIDRIEPLYPNASVFDAWFAIKEDLVCWIRFKSKGDSVELWAIETRPGYLNNGFARQSLELLKNKYNTSDILHDGGYTPEGENFIAKYLKHVGDPREHLSYPSTNFVKNWTSDRRCA